MLRDWITAQRDRGRDGKALGLGLTQKDGSPLGTGLALDNYLDPDRSVFILIYPALYPMH